MRDLVEALVGFAETARAAGLDAGPDRVQAMVAALDQFDSVTYRNIYWAGRVTLCGSREDLDRYDAVFDAHFFGAAEPPPRLPPPTLSRRALGMDPDGRGAGADGVVQVSAASRIEVLRQRDISTLDAADRDEVGRLISAMDVHAPMRRSRRHRPAVHGLIDVERTTRAAVRCAGEPIELHWRARRPKPRRLVIIVDISGSMAAFADALLRFSHAATRRSARRVEVFTVGTKLTRVTSAISSPDPDVAMAAVAAVVPDWSGGTRLGEELKEFIDRFGRGAIVRGATVVIASDGWERDAPELLGHQMARLRRLAHRIIWVNPHKGVPGYEPLATGMQAALPYLHELVAGHSAAALQSLAEVIGDD
jgi:uncharacterized protein with von Willebrand factor type A (vWA) domain